VIVTLFLQSQPVGSRITIHGGSSQEKYSLQTGRNVKSGKRPIECNSGDREAAPARRKVKSRSRLSVCRRNEPGLPLCSFFAVSVFTPKALFELAGAMPAAQFLRVGTNFGPEISVKI
jgi:hypothetical protein